MKRGFVLLALAVLAAGCGSPAATPTTAPTPVSIAATVAPAATATLEADIVQATPTAGASPRATDVPLSTETSTRSTPTAASAPTEASAPSPAANPEPVRSLLLDNLDWPAALAFAPDGRLFYNELRTGRVRIVTDGRLQERPFATLDVVHLDGYSEHGLLGLALHPEFTRNHFVYVFYSVPGADGGPQSQRLVRFTERDGVGTEMRVILDDLPVGPACCHNGGRLAFGPDGKLYVTIGDTQNDKLAQDPRALAGKVLRIDADGTVPADNPSPGSPVFALGLRNPFGMAFHPLTGGLFVTDNGPSGFDEIDLVRKGGNYGWPVVVGQREDSRYISPLWTSGETSIAPTGATFYTSDQLPQWRSDFFHCAFLPGKLVHVKLAPPAYDSIAEREEVAAGCQNDVKTGPDGALYFSDTGAIYRLGK